MAAKTKSKPARKARAKAKPRAKKTAAKKPKKAGPVRKAASKPKPAKKRAPAKPKRAKTEPAVDTGTIDATEQTDATDDGSGAEKKPGALARLTSGVGKLFAKMTGRGKPQAVSESDGIPNDDAIEVVTADIVVHEPVEPVGPAPKTRKKPPPSIED